MSRIVHRPEPAPDDVPKPKLTPEEIRALVTVAKTSSRSGLATTGRRAAFAFLPVAIVSTLLDWLIGFWSVPVVAALAIAWCARPLLRQGRDGWV